MKAPNDFLLHLNWFAHTCTRDPPFPWWKCISYCSVTFKLFGIIKERSPEGKRCPGVMDHREQRKYVNKVTGQQGLGGSVGTGWPVDSAIWVSQTPVTPKPDQHGSKTATGHVKKKPEGH